MVPALFTIRQGEVTRFDFKEPGLPACDLFLKPIRGAGGRSFCFTGLDAHSAWSVGGVHQLMVNAILWSAGLTIPANRASCVVSPTELQSNLTLRGSQAAGGAETLATATARSVTRRGCPQRGESGTSMLGNRDKGVDDEFRGDFLIGGERQC